MAIQPTNSSATLPATDTALQKGNVAAGAPVAIRSVASSAVPLSTVQQPGAVPDLSTLEQAVKDLNKAMQTQSANLEFSVDEDSNRTIVKVIDQQTQEVLRQIPSEEALKISKALNQVSGLLIRQKA
ncbi:flagellar protein FlaG [Noviherbaspirillum sp. Root189]|uniref:flagellar protein FlaG n=1 Tax=Noviherbaspirillum sp. Root189 TaxID=1736487 RepID=UPI0009EA9176|nr:flagellar protein FlaG [Noviherbaspirillum sp. Root189]